MKTSCLRWAVVWLAMAVCSGFAQTPPPVTLKLGDPAPKLQTGKWVQGEPVKEFEKGKTYLVEFWATWCGPCINAIPHLNEIQARFEKKGLIVIGQNCLEHDESKVEPFVKQMGEKMKYRIVLDDKSKIENGAMVTTWMAAAGRQGIPSTFVVDKTGKITWIGHPMELTDPTLEKIIAGTYDVKQAIQEAAEMEQKQAQLTKLSQTFSGQMATKNWTEAEKTLDEIEKLLPEQGRSQLAMPRLNVLYGKRDFKAAYKLAGEIGEKNKDNAGFQNHLALEIATRQGLEDRDFKLAEKMSARAVELTKGQDANMLAALARIQFLSGQNSKALETQQKAVDRADESRKAEFKTTLENYKAGKGQ